MKATASFCTNLPDFMRKLFKNQKSISTKKNLIRPWITTRVMKSSKQKQKLYNKFLKLRTKENEVTYKPYKNLFEAIRKKSKRTYYSELLKNIKIDIKNTWKFIKEITSNTKNKRKDLPEKSVINNTTVVEKQEIALQKIA